jgi:hypothetical protein
MLTWALHSRAVEPGRDHVAHAKDKGNKTTKKKAQASIKEKRAAKKAKKSATGR